MVGQEAAPEFKAAFDAASSSEGAPHGVLEDGSLLFGGQAPEEETCTVPATWARTG